MTLNNYPRDKISEQGGNLAAKYRGILENI